MVRYTRKIKIRVATDAVAERQKGNKTMTNKEFLTAVSDNQITEDVIAHAKEALRRLNDRAATASAAKNEADAPLIEKIVETLTSTHRVHTAAELAAVLGVHTSKATNLCKKIPNIKISDVQVDRRVVKGYSL